MISRKNRPVARDVHVSPPAREVDHAPRTVVGLAVAALLIAPMRRQARRVIFTVTTLLDAHWIWRAHWQRRGEMCVSNVNYFKHAQTTFSADVHERVAVLIHGVPVFKIVPIVPLSVGVVLVKSKQFPEGDTVPVTLLPVQ